VYNSPASKGIVSSGWKFAKRSDKSFGFWEYLDKPGAQYDRKRLQNKIQWMSTATFKHGKTEGNYWASSSHFSNNCSNWAAFSRSPLSALDVLNKTTPMTAIASQGYGLINKIHNSYLNIWCIYKV
jgi:hypothetical protein